MAIKTVRIIKELIEIWPNEVCDKKREEELQYSRLKNSCERIQHMPKVQAETQFLVVLFGIPVDYFDPTFFNA